MTKWNYQITKASEIPEIMAKAFYIARSGRPGPVLIDITKMHNLSFRLPMKNAKEYGLIVQFLPFNQNKLVRRQPQLMQQKTHDRLGSRGNTWRSGGRI